MLEDSIYERLENAILNAINGKFSESRTRFTEALQNMSVIVAISKGELREERRKLFQCIKNCIKNLDDYTARLLQEPQPTFISQQNGIFGDSFQQKDFSTESTSNITFDDVIGLEDVKQAIYHKIIYPQKHKELYKLFDKKSGGGILLYGLPGTGKTMIAKATANEINAKFFAVKCSDLGSKWFGETENNLKCLFEQARQVERAIIFFDEIEAYASKRHDDTTTERIVAEFLTQLQGFKENNETILFMAATNRPWDIDSAFLRPGRFDDKIYVPLPNINARQEIICKKLKAVPCESTIDCKSIASMTEGYNCADIDYVCEKAKEKAIDQILQGERRKRILLQIDLYEALNCVKSSVSETDKLLLQQWQKTGDNL